MCIIILMELEGELLPIDYACRAPPLVSYFAPFPEDLESGATLDQIKPIPISIQRCQLIPLSPFLANRIFPKQSQTARAL